MESFRFLPRVTAEGRAAQRERAARLQEGRAKS
jgi:hypothetical protein